MALAASPGDAIFSRMRHDKCTNGSKVFQNTPSFTCRVISEEIPWGQHGYPVALILFHQIPWRGRVLAVTSCQALRGHSFSHQRDPSPCERAGPWRPWRPWWLWPLRWTYSMPWCLAASSAVLPKLPTQQHQNDGNRGVALLDFRPK